MSINLKMQWTNGRTDRWTDGETKGWPAGYSYDTSTWYRTRCSHKWKLKECIIKVSLLDTVILTLTYDLVKLIRSGHCHYQCFKFEKNQSRAFWVIALWLRRAADAASTWNHNIRRSYGYGGYKWQTHEIWSKVIIHLRIFNIIFSISLFLHEPSHRTQDAMITALLHQNNIATLFQRNNKVIITPCVQWDGGDWGTHGWYLKIKWTSQWSINYHYLHFVLGMN